MAPLRTFMSVLLPAPFSPIKARTSPAARSSETPSSARVARTTWRRRSSSSNGGRRHGRRRQHAGPFQGPQHAEGARLVGAEDPVDLSPVARHQALGLLLGRVGGRAGVLGVREVGDLGEFLGEGVGEALLALLGAIRADRIPEQDDLPLAVQELAQPWAASTPPW